MPILCDPAETTVTWRGLTLGMSGDPTLSDRTTIGGLDLLDVDATDLPTGFGEQPGKIAYPARDIALTRVLCLSTATVGALRALMIAGDADAAPEALDLVVPTMWAGTRRAYVVPRRCSSSIDRKALVTRSLSRDLLWTAHDPRLYSTEETPFELPDVVAHAGDVPAPWRAVLNGPVDGPEVRRTDTGQAIRWPTVVLGAGQFLDLDLRDGTAWVGSIDVSGLAVDDDDRPPVEWEVPPGAGVEMTTNAPSGTVWVRDAWL